MKRQVGFIAMAMVLLVGQAKGGDRTDVPLRNWGGFAVNRHWTYDAVEKLVLAGLADRVVFNTKPMSRLEMARIVARAVEKIRQDELGLYNDRQDLEPILYTLIEEFKPELAQLGVTPVAQAVEPHGPLFLKPVDKLAVRFGVTEDTTFLENGQGDLLREGVSGRLAVLSRAQVGDHLSFLLHPEFRLQQGPEQGRLVEGAVKLSGFGLEALIGRESLWWGPGFHGGLLFSNNAPPLDLIRFSTEAFIPPWYFKYLGPTKLTLAAARLDEDRDFPRTKLLAFRIDLSPFPFLELGFSPAIQYNGEGQPSIEFYEIPELIWRARSSSRTISGSKFGDTNALFSVDATLRFPNINRYVPIGRDLKLYGEMGVDDIDIRVLEVIVIPRKPAVLVGAYIQNLFQLPNMDLRFEYAQTSSISFNHSTYTTGFSFKDRPLAHFIGTRGRDVYVRLTRSLRADLFLGLEAGYSEIGSTKSQASSVREKRLFSGFDLSYRLLDNLSLFGRFRLHRFENFNFVPGSDDTVPAFSLEATYSF